MLNTLETPTNNTLAPANLVIDTGKETNNDEPDFLIGATCNPNNPEECEACQ